MKINQATRKLMEYGAPFRVISILNHEIRLYWTKNKGTYGYQVVTVIFTDNTLSHTSVTKGCGYCKESQATRGAFIFVGLVPRENSHLPGEVKESQIDYKYKVGGNFYKVPRKDTMIVRGTEY